MRTLIVKHFSFEASHELPNHMGKCRRLHGHSYKVDVGVTGLPQPIDGSSSEGMVVDFSLVSQVFRSRVFDVCDHYHLNDVLPIAVTTAELIAAWILSEMKAGLASDAPGVTVSFVRVYETESSYAEVQAVTR